MNVMEPIAEAAERRWQIAEREADAFRGAFVRHHARGEALIGEALLALHRSRRGGPPVDLPHLAGQRLATLRDAVDKRAAADPHLPSVRATLDRFKTFERVRGFLCHGTATITLDRQQNWCLGINLTSFRGQQAEYDSLFVAKADAALLLADLQEAVTRLSSSLGHVRKYAG